MIISPTQSGIGGIAQHVSGLQKFLVHKSHKVEIISSENTFTIPIKGLKNPSFILSSFLKAKFQKNYDIVHAHNIPAAFAMKNTSGKKILSLHGIFSDQISEIHGKTCGKISKKFEMNALEWADAITVVSKDALDYYSKFGFKVYQIPNAIDLSSIETNEDRLYEKQLIFAGRLSKEKGIDILIEISKKLPLDIHLIILGSGSYKKKIQDLEKTNKNIHYLGNQTKEKTLSLIRGSDILIQPSINEGISSTLLESMALGTAIITTNTGGNIELIENQINGILVEINDSDSFVNHIMSLLKNVELRKSLEKNALLTVKKYDWKYVCSLYLKLYEDLLKK